MPDTADHRAEVHLLVRARQSVGLPVWDKKIQLADIWKNDDLSFPEQRDMVVERITKSGWLETTTYPYLQDVLNGLGSSEDEPSFNLWWAQLYDLADYDRVWINLH